MKKTLLALLLSLFALTAPAAGFYQEPGQLYGVYHIYDYGAFEKAKVPRGYKLLSINHYGRHGARYQDSKDAYTGVLDALLAGRRDGVLTPLGESVCSRTEAFFALCKDHYGELTERGWNQELCIAENMYRAAPASFWKKARITASSSMSRRCMMTMTAFCTGLTRSNPKLNLYACNSKTLLDATNPGDKSNVNYVETKPEPSPWGASYTSVLFSQITEDRATDILLRLFKDREYIRTHFSSAVGYCAGLYNMVAGMGCVGDDIRIDDVFTEKELLCFYNAINYGFFEWSVLNKDCFKPILTTMLREADEDIATGSETVRLKFGHDVNLLAIMHMLQVEDLGIFPEKLEDLGRTWHCWMTPMAANLEFFFYWNPRDGKVLVLPYLNGRIVRIAGLDRIAGSFYRWEDLRPRFEG